MNIQTDILRSTLLSYVKTNSIILDLIIGTFLFAIMNKTIDWISKCSFDLTFLRNLSLKKKNEILLTRKEFISTNYWDNKINYPKSILAIFNHIHSCKYPSQGTMRLVDHKSKHISKINYILDIKKPIEIQPNIYFKQCQNDYGKIITQNDRGEKMFEHQYSLYSYSYSLHELTTLLQQWIQKLDHDLINDLNQCPMYFMYDKKEDPNHCFEEYPLNHCRNFTNIFFDQKELLKNRIDFFLNNQEWYMKKGIPYTLGIMFSGNPGCGKTSTIKAIAKYTNRHIIDIPLSKIETCQELMNIFFNTEINGKNIPMNKRIYLFEDIDSILDILKDRQESNLTNDSLTDLSKTITDNISQLIKKENTSSIIKPKNDKLNLGFFLNLLDGVLETPGRILILSTNYPDKLDRALVRPGRIDIKIHLEKCNKKMIHDIIHHYYSELNLEPMIIQSIYEKELTPAELYQILFKFTSFDSFITNIQQYGFDSIFNETINREEEELLRIQCKMIPKCNPINPIKSKKQNTNRFIKKENKSSDSDSD